MGLGCQVEGAGIVDDLVVAPAAQGRAGVRGGCVEPVSVQGSGFRVQGSGFRVQGSGFRVQGSGCRVQDSGFRV